MNFEVGETSAMDEIYGLLVPPALQATSRIFEYKV